jgi:heterodisulfide reductase subunit A
LLHATGASLDGIYVAGCAAAPCDVATSVTQGQAAAGDAVSKLMPEREIELEVMTCVIDDERCAGCRLCIGVCPYKAISFDRQKRVSVINEAVCRGCGTCAAACACGAAKAKHFTDGQILAEIGGLMHV